MSVDFLSVSLSTSMIILLFAIFTLVFPKKISASFRYFIWLCIAIRLLIPINMAWGFTPIQIPTEPLTQVSESFSSSVDAVTFTQGQTDRTTTSADKTFTPRSLLIGLWLLGVMVFLNYYFLRYYLFCRQIRPWCKEVSFCGKVPVFQCKNISTPMLIGILRPRILIPANQYDSDYLSMILQHEGTHYKRKDIWYKWLLLLVNAIHWFNPTVYLLRKSANRDLEFSCDEIILKGQSTAYKQKYAELILSTVVFKENIALGTCLKSSEALLKSRLLNIADCGRKKSIFFPIVVILILVFLSTSVAANSAERGFLQKLNPFLPVSITDRMDYHKTADQGNTAFSLWGEFQEDGETFLQDIQITEEGGVLTSYIYKDYGFLAKNIKKSPISLDAGEKLANRFGKVFLEKKSPLVFAHIPYENHLYNPGHVESFIAQDGNSKHVIMVNLDYGIVVSYEKI